VAFLENILLTIFIRLFETSKYSDIELVSTHRVYEVHRAVVCSWSTVINKSCDFNAAKADRIEAELDEHGMVKPSFNFGDADPQAVDCVVQFFYFWEYKVRPLLPSHIVDRDVLREGNGDPPEPEKTAPEGQLLVLHSKVFTLAHMYDIPRLRELSVTKFRAVAQVQWESDSLLDAAREAYSSTPSDVREMREAIVKTFCKHRSLLEQDHIKAFLIEMPDLSVDLLMHINQNPGPFHTHT
jgi:hypothetical protein